MKILIAGDFCPRYRVADKFEQGEYEYVLGEIKDIIVDADYSIVNLECPAIKGGEVPIEKCGPNLQCSEKGIEAVKWAGFDCVTLANNHFLDFGKEGVEHTLEICKKHGIETVGGGMNLQEASSILYKEIDGKILAIINCCEHEFSIATEETAGSNPLNPIKQYYAIKEAKEKADYVLVIVHGGHEQYQLPSPRMQETYRFFIDAGADAVVNHHQHCYSGYEVYKGKPIFYGIGNFCFDNINRHDIWNEGYMVFIFFNSNNITFEKIPYVQCDDEAKVKLKEDVCYSKSIIELNTIIHDNKLLLNADKEYYKSCLRSVSSILEPISNKYILGIQRRGLLPSFLKKKKKLQLQNYILCESHRDKLSFVFKQI